MFDINQIYTTIKAISVSNDHEILLVKKRENNTKYLIKVFRPDSNYPKLIRRRINIYREIEFIASLDHPNIAKPIEAIIKDDVSIIIYPWQECITLAKALNDQVVFTIQDSLNIVIQLLDAVECIHRSGIIHCDINPNNILINTVSGVQILDFSLALTEDEAMRLPEGQLIGTLPYLSPEQTGFTNFKICPQSDLFCLTVILYQLLSGKLPFGNYSGSISDFLDSILKTSIDPIKNVHVILNKILLKSLRSSPEERYQTAHGLKYDLSLALRIIRNEPIEKIIPGQKDATISINRSKLFVARESEIAFLKKAFNNFKKGQVTSVVLTGASGIGKTEIVKNFKKTIDLSSFFFVSAKSNRFTPNQPYSIIRTLFLDFIRILFDSQWSSIHFKENFIKDKLFEYAGSICTVIPEFNQYFDRVILNEKVEKEKEADKICHQLAMAIQKICSEIKVVFFIDDLQWIDKMSYDILNRIKNANVNCMTICTYRTEGDFEIENIFIHGQPFKFFSENILKIEALNSNEIRWFTFATFGELSHDEKFVNAIENKSLGNPYLIKEIFRFLINNSLVKFGESGWILESNSLEEIPSKFDYISLILYNLKRFTPEEKRLFQLASLIEGKIETHILEQLYDGSGIDIHKTLSKFEQFGLIIKNIEGFYFFVHDRLQEEVSNNILQEEKKQLYNKLGRIYETLCEKDKNYIFYAAESYLKSDNLLKAFEISYKAGNYAIEKTVFDQAIRYFKNALLMNTAITSQAIKATIPSIELETALADALMLDGRNEQALRMFNNILDKYKIQKLFDSSHIKYKIGLIHLNMGYFETASQCFLSLLSELGVKLPKKSIFLILSVFLEMLKLLFVTPILSAFKYKKVDDIVLLKVKILNKLSYAFYFTDPYLCLLPHFRAFNLGSRFVANIDKVESYALHLVPIYQLFMRNRAGKIAKKAIEYAKNLLRPDLASLSESYLGIIKYYSAKWDESIQLFQRVIKTYSFLGDISNQFIPHEHLWRIELKRGNFASALKIMEDTILICKKADERHFFMSTQAAHCYLKFLQTGNPESDTDLLLSKAQSLNAFLTETHVGLFLLEIDVLKGDLQKAYNYIKKLRPSILQKGINTEYNVPYFALICELIIYEILSRKNGKENINISSKKLLKQFYSAWFFLLFSVFSFPAYKGNLYRSLALLLSVKGFKKLAGYFFRKSIKIFHTLDMRYEEAKAIRDYGLFLYEWRLPGDARDQLDKAYKIFTICGAHYEAQKIEFKVSSDIIDFLVDKKYKISQVNDTSIFNTDQVNQIRFDTLYEVSSTMSEIGDLNILLKQIIQAMIKATGAQYGCLQLSPDKEGVERIIAMDFEGKELDRNSIQIPDKIIEQVQKDNQVVVVNSMLAEDRSDGTGPERRRSVMCVPLLRNTNFLGYIYLGNDRMSAVFTENARKAAQILSAQAAILLENGFLFENFKRLNRDLDIKIKQQTKDITEKNRQLEQANLRLVESERMKGLLSGSLVHDIKNYAAGIEGNLRVISKRFPHEAKLQRTLGVVTEACTDIVSLASNLLDIGKMDEGRLNIKPELLDFDHLELLIEKYVFHSTFEEKGIIPKVIPPSETFEIEADVYLMERVFQNIFSNAAKYVPRGGDVILSFISNESENIICFFNSGTPIPEQDREVLFEKYARLESRSSQYSKGLGLFFCRMVLNAHGGKIWVESNEKGNYFKLAFRKTLVHKLSFNQV